MQNSSYLADRFGEIVLASSSPRRAQILRQVGLRFIIKPSHIKEVFTNGDPVEQAKRISREKAAEIVTLHAEQIVLSADTIVVIDGRLLGKPEDASDAFEMLKLLSAREHQVHTAFTVWRGADDKIETDAVTTQVRFKKLSDAWIHRYVESGSPFDKAGAYGIQDQSALFIDSIDGDFYNVVGLPIARVMEVMEQHF